MGKTVFAVSWLIRKVLTCPLERPRAHYFAPTYRQAKSIAWDYVRAHTEHIPGMVYNKTELSASFSGGQRIQLVGADSPDAFRGQYTDAFCMDEVSMMAPRFWTEIVRPAAADREATGLFIGTPAGRNFFWELYDRAANLEDWGRQRLSYLDTGLIPAREIASLKAEMDESSFRQEMLCDFQAAVRGAYYGEVLSDAEAAGRVGAVPYDDSMGVWTAWDLGMADSSAVWFIQQSPGGQVRLIDYLEVQGMGLPEIISRIRAKPYKQYDGHIAPHDIRVRELGTGASRFETAMKLGIRFTVARNIPLMDGIEATRQMLKRTWVDVGNCREGLTHLQLYRSEWDDRKRIFSLRPLHDHTSHAADALRMFAVERGQSHSKDWGQGINYDMLDKMA